MTAMTGVGGMSVADFALRLSALRGTAAYAAYVVSAPDMEDVLLDLEEELRTVASHDAVARIAPLDGDHLVTDLAATSIEMIVVDARTFAAHDWALLDRRRSAIAHRGVLVLVTTPTSFNELMRRAPNLASWLGGEVFAYPSDVNATAAAHREQRLAALRAWASQTDEQVISAARAGTLARDPEYAEWLVLLGHGDLLPRDPS